MALFINRDAFARGVSVSSSVGQISSRADWTTPSRGLFRPVGQAKGAVSVTDSVNVVTSALLEQVGPVVSDAINDRFVPVAQLAFDQWPVSTGLSKSQLFLEILPGNDEITAKLVNLAPYAGGIHDGQVAKELFFEPGKIAAAQMARDIARGLAS